MLNKGVYGTEFRPVTGRFGLSCGQLRGSRVIHNGGWYNIYGEKIGWGDLSHRDLENISHGLTESEVFVILAEHSSYWAFVSSNKEMNRVDPKEESPGLDYILNHFVYLIIKGKIYSRERPPFTLIDKERALELIEACYDADLRLV